MDLNPVQLYDKQIWWIQKIITIFEYEFFVENLNALEDIVCTRQGNMSFIRICQYKNFQGSHFQIY